VKPKTTTPSIRADLLVVVVALAGVPGCAARPPARPATAGDSTATLQAPAVAAAASGTATGDDTPTRAGVAVERREVSLPAGRVVFDLYAPGTHGAAPLVVVAHGFWRSRANMAGWGRHLAQEGFLAAVPDLPAGSDHARNGRAVNELIAWLLAHPPATVPIDDERIAVLGFSAGGLATLLAAADNPRIRLWIGLDPVDRGNAGATAAARLAATAVLITAEPSSCNGQGNAAAIGRALGERVTAVAVPAATHADAEWPTDWKARLLCGGSSKARRALFVEHATRALRALTRPSGPRPESPDPANPPGTGPSRGPGVRSPPSGSPVPDSRFPAPDSRFPPP
jgi:dienelactone hydrolase